jgi:hypothetical protein
VTKELKDAQRAEFLESFQCSQPHQCDEVNPLWEVIIMSKLVSPVGNLLHIKDALNCPVL